MTAQQSDIARILTAEGAIRRRDHPDLDGSIAWLARQGRLRRVLPGVYVDPAHPDPLKTRIAAVGRWNGDAVLTGAVAAKLTFWPDVRVDEIELALPTASVPSPGFRITRRRLPPELVAVRHGVRFTTPAATALDVCVNTNGESIDTVLRSRQARLADLHAAMDLLAGRRGNAQRRALLLDSRDSPWSTAERRTHRLLRDAEITGWFANWPLEMLAWTYYVDVAFPKAKLAIEIDGREFHTSPAAFEADRSRQNDLILAGWRVLRFTYAMVTEHPLLVITSIRRALGY